MARRTLVIGLGSTGTTICNNLMERIAWEYGSADKVPFVDFLGIDSDKGIRSDDQQQVEAMEQVRRLTDAGKMAYVTLTRQEVDGLIDGPTNFDSTFDFTKWFDTSLLQRTAMESGAGHVRMVGRLLFLYTRNLQAVHGRITGAINKLNSLPSTVSVSWGNDTRQFQLDNEVVVYVIGTLCGGTASGSFIDMGYLLQAIQNSLPSVSITTIGVFAVPNSGHLEPMHNANAHAALVELNHFSTERNDYRQKISLPTLNELRKIDDKVYTYPYIIAPRETGANALDTLWVQCAQFVWADVFSPVGADRNGVRVNLTTDFLSKDLLGFNQRFLTFGTSIVEYPAALIIQGCAYRLIAKSLSTVAEDKDVAALPIGGTLESRGFTSEATAASLQKCDEPAVITRIEQHLGNSVDTWGGTADLTAYERSIEKAFGAQNQAQALLDMPPDFITHLLLDNGPRTRQDLMRNLKELLRKGIADPKRGVAYCLAVVSRAISYVESRCGAIRESDIDDRIGNARAGKDHCIEEIDVVLQDGISSAVFLQRPAINHYQREYEEWALEFFELRLQKATEAAEENVLTWVGKELSKLQRRLSNLRLLLRNAGDAASRRYAKRRDYIPLVNGISLFDAGEDGTVDTEYSQILLGDPPQEPQRMLEVCDGLGTVFDEAFLGWDEQSALDDAPDGNVARFAELSYETRNKLEAIAGSCFASLKDVSAVDRLMADPTKAAAEAAKVWNASELLLNVRAADPSHYEHALKYYELLYFQNAEAAIEGKALARQNEFATLVKPHTSPTAHNKWASLVDPTQVVFLRERGSFPLRIVSALDTLARSEPLYRKNANVSSVNARLDVHWEPTTPEDREKYVRALELLIVGVALECIKAPPGRADFTFDRKARSWGTAEPVSISRDLRSEALKIRFDPEFMDELEDVVSESAGKEGDAGVMRRIERFLEGYGALAIRGVTMQEAQLMLEEYCVENPHLKEHYTEQLEVVAVTQILHAEDATHPAEGYYCPNHDTPQVRCPMYWVDLAKIPEWCPYCRRRLRKPQ